jgi:hypothetical protein
MESSGGNGGCHFRNAYCGKLFLLMVMLLGLDYSLVRLVFARASALLDTNDAPIAGNGKLPRE